MKRLSITFILFSLVFLFFSCTFDTNTNKAFTAFDPDGIRYKNNISNDITEIANYTRLTRTEGTTGIIGKFDREYWYRWDLYTFTEKKHQWYGDEGYATSEYLFVDARSGTVEYTSETPHYKLFKIGDSYYAELNNESFTYGTSKYYVNDNYLFLYSLTDSEKEELGLK